MLHNSFFVASNLFHSRHIPSLLIIQHYNIRSDQYMATFFVSPYETTAVEINDCQPLWKSVLSVDSFALNAKISTRTVQQEHVRVHIHLLYFRENISFVHIQRLKPGVQLPVTLSLTSARVYSLWMYTCNSSLGCKSYKCFHCCVSLSWLLILQEASKQIHFLCFLWGFG